MRSANMVTRATRLHKRLVGKEVWVSIMVPSSACAGEGFFILKFDVYAIFLPLINNYF